MDYAKLKVEITRAEYAGKGDEQVAVLLNEKRPVDIGFRSLETKEVLDAWTAATIAKVEDAAATTNAQGHEPAAAFDAYISAAGQLDVAPGSAGRVVLDALVAAKVIVQADADALVAMARRIEQLTWWEAKHQEPVLVGHVREARRWQTL